MLYLISILLFVPAVLLQYGYALLFFRGLRNRPKAYNEQQLPVSVVICARNEAPQLERFLPAVLQQDYPAELFEVVVVNDASSDASAAVLEAFSKQYSNLKVVTIDAAMPRTLPGKKFALQHGIAAAQHELLLLTDADCRPATPSWISSMLAGIRHPGGKDALVLGYGAYEEQAGLLNRFIRWETAHTCIQYASYALAGKTYMGVGRNMLYSKSLPARAAAAGHLGEVYAATPSGDDDLLISAIAPQAHTTICLDEQAHTISIAQDSWGSWWKQKTRHVSTGKYYKRGIRNLLGLYGLSHSLYWFCGLALIFSGNGEPVTAAAGVLFLLRLSLYWILSAKWYRLLHEKKLLLFYPLGDLGWAFYNVFLSPFIFWKNKQTWK